MFRKLKDNLLNIGGIRMIANEQIRNKISSKRLRKWEVAEKVGISDSRFSVWLRTPLNNERKKRVEQAIKELSESIAVK